ncbi:dihydroorotase [Bacillus gobiensis]|uniref:dihydroorotase n=1 Tax=Bacillus gobiensis TaxID=1441095 RepID=UPI003D1A56EE
MTMRIINNVNIVTHKEIFRGSITFCDGKITEIVRHQNASLSASDHYLLPGCIDTHVHFREPGFEEKEEIPYASMAAIAGGVTAICDMPNTNPPLDRVERINEKTQLFEEKCIVDYAFHFLGTEYNLDEIRQLQPNCVASVKVFLAGHHTAKHIMRNKEKLLALMSILKEKNILLTVHAEEESLILPDHEENYEKYTFGRGSGVARKAIETLVKACELTKCRIHILHVSSKEEINEILKAKEKGIPITFEVIPPHLFFNYQDMEEIGAKIKLSPPLRTVEDQHYLIECLKDKKVDTVGSDHAPHTLKDKQQAFKYAPPGMPGVQEMLPVLYTTFLNANVSKEEAMKLCIYYLSYQPANIFHVKNKGEIQVGKDADFTVFNVKEGVFHNRKIYTKNNWSPYENRDLQGRVEEVFIRGNRIFKQGEIILPGQRANALCFY